MKIQENLKEQYVAYLDVLGFKDLVSKRKITEVETYFNTVDTTLKELRYDKSNIRSLLISDSTILISPDSTDDFITLLKAVQTIQAVLVKKNIWLRGAISFGDVFFDEERNVVVGKGLVNAFLLEQEAVYPRVIIDSSIIPKIAKTRDDFFKTINPDHTDYHKEKMKLVHNWSVYNEDDAFFVAYGHKLIIEAIKNRTIDVIFKKVSDNIYSNHQHYKKFLWVRKYLLEILSLFDETWDASGLSIEQRRLDKRYIATWFRKFSEL